MKRVSYLLRTFDTRGLRQNNEPFSDETAFYSLGEIDTSFIPMYGSEYRNELVCRKQRTNPVLFIAYY